MEMELHHRVVLQSQISRRAQLLQRTTGPGHHCRPGPAAACVPSTGGDHMHLQIYFANGLSLVPKTEALGSDLSFVLQGQYRAKVFGALCGTSCSLRRLRILFYALSVWNRPLMMTQLFAPVDRF